MSTTGKQKRLAGFRSRQSLVVLTELPQEQVQCHAGFQGLNHTVTQVFISMAVG